MQDFQIKLFKVRDFIKTDIWRISLKDLPRIKALLIGQLRVLLLAIRRFDKDNCPLRASALTFYSLLSVVPVAAMAFGIAKGFGFEKLLESQLLEKFPGQEEVVVRIVEFARNFLESTKGGMIAGIGLAVLLWMVVKVIGNIESSFNAIWKVKRQRPFGRKFSDYLSIMLIAPILVIMSSSITVFIKAEITTITKEVALLGYFSPLIFFMLKLLPYFLIWVLFSIVYTLIPNTRVNFTSGILAGIIAGTIYQIAQLVYITFQIGVTQYNAIYGSFAALPLFLVWLQISWLIVLFGAEISFAHQNVDLYEYEPDLLRISPACKRLLSLGIAHLVIKKFSMCEKPLTAVQISQISRTPLPLVYQILNELVDSGVFSGIKTEAQKELTYQPACDINVLTIQYVIESLEKRGLSDLPVAGTKELRLLSETLKSFENEIEKSPANKLLKDI